MDSDIFLADCPARTTLELLTDTWSVLVVFGLRDGARRHSELLERIGGVSKKMLTQTLRKLERNGLVARRELRSAPPGVEYSLTPLGVTMLEPIAALSRWAEENADDIAGSRDPVRREL